MGCSMSTTESQQSTRPVALNEQLESDKSGELRDRMVDELQVAAGEIRAALGSEVAEADAAILKGLLDAVTLGEGALVEVWNTFHGIEGSAASMPAR